LFWKRIHSPVRQLVDWVKSVGEHFIPGRLRPSTDKIVWLKKGRKRPAISALEISTIPIRQPADWAMEDLNIRGLSRRQNL